MATTRRRSYHGTRKTHARGLPYFFNSLLRSRGPGLVLVLGMVACGPPPSQESSDTGGEGAVDTAADVAAIHEAVDALFDIYQAGDADSVVTFYTHDHVLMAPGAPTVRGTAALAEQVRSNLALGRWTLSASTESLEVLGDDAIQVGRYSLGFEATDATPAGLTDFDDEGRYMIRWRRGEGRWRIREYMANRDGTGGG